MVADRPGPTGAPDIIFSGMLEADDAPPEYRRVACLLRRAAARRPGGPTGEDGFLAARRAVLAGRSEMPPATAPKPSAFRRATVAMAVTAGAALAAATAAAAQVLPPPARAGIDLALVPLGLELPGRQTAPEVVGTPSFSSGPPGALARAQPATSAGLEGAGARTSWVTDGDAHDDHGPGGDTDHGPDVAGKPPLEAEPDEGGSAGNADDARATGPEDRDDHDAGDHDAGDGQDDNNDDDEDDEDEGGGADGHDPHVDDQDDH